MRGEPVAQKTPEILRWTYIVVIGLPNGAKIKRKNILLKNPQKCSTSIWENQFSHDFSMLDMKVFRSVPMGQTGTK